MLRRLLLFLAKLVVNWKSDELLVWFYFFQIKWSFQLKRSPFWILMTLLDLEGMIFLYWTSKYPAILSLKVKVAVMIKEIFNPRSHIFGWKFFLSFTICAGNPISSKEKKENLLFPAKEGQNDRIPNHQDRHLGLIQASRLLTSINTIGKVKRMTQLQIINSHVKIMLETLLIPFN